VRQITHLRITAVERHPRGGALGVPLIDLLRRQSIVGPAAVVVVRPVVGPVLRSVVGPLGVRVAVGPFGIPVVAVRPIVLRPVLWVAIGARIAGRIVAAPAVALMRRSTVGRLP